MGEKMGMSVNTKQKVAGNARRARCSRGKGAAPWHFFTLKLVMRHRICKANRPEKPEPGSENEKSVGHVPLYDYLTVYAEDPVWKACQ